MISPEEKLFRPATAGTHARATLKQLLVKWGVPELVYTSSMDKREVWTYISGSGQDAIFERRDEVGP